MSDESRFLAPSFPIIKALKTREFIRIRIYPPSEHGPPAKKQIVEVKFNKTSRSYECTNYYFHFAPFLSLALLIKDGGRRDFNINNLNLSVGGCTELKSVCAKGQPA